jgi:hypothetical protein
VFSGQFGRFRVHFLAVRAAFRVYFAAAAVKFNFGA